MLKSFSRALLSAALMLPVASADTIVDITLGSPDHETLVAAVTQAGLVDVLNSSGPLTVFAPTDDAFDEVDNKYFEEEWASHLIDILTFHVASGNITSADLVAGAPVPMVNMESANITSLDPPMINGAEIETPDLMASNGVVHVINQVLLPDSATNSIVDVALANEDFITLTDLLVLADLTDTLSGEGPFTVFAPTNAAFKALDNATVTFLTSEEGLADLTDILLYHVVPGILLSEAAEDGGVETINGAELMVLLPNTTLFNETDATAVSRTTAGSIMINDATVTSADILVNNGVIHVIDSILLPPAPPVATEEEDEGEEAPPVEEEEEEEEDTDKNDKDDKDQEEAAEEPEEEEEEGEDEEDEMPEEEPVEENEEEEEEAEEDPEENEEEEEMDEEEPEEEEENEEEDVDMDAENGM